MTSGHNARVIPLGRLVRMHGFPKAGIVTLKADLFNSDATLLKGRAQLWIAPPESTDFKLIDLAAPSSPHGADWAHAKGALFRFFENHLPVLKSEIGLPRDLFPTLSAGFYVCDLIGKEVIDEKGQVRGIVTRFFEAGGDSPTRSLNLEMTNSKGKAIEFPMAWIEKVDERILVPQIIQWEEIT